MSGGTDGRDNGVDPTAMALVRKGLATIHEELSRLGGNVEKLNSKVSETHTGLALVGKESEHQAETIRRLERLLTRLEEAHERARNDIATQAKDAAVQQEQLKVVAKGAAAVRATWVSGAVALLVGAVVEIIKKLLSIP